MHWADVVDNLCGLAGCMAEEFADIDRAVDVARGYPRDLRYSTLLQELTDGTLDMAAHEADERRYEASPDPARYPAVMGLTMGLRGLLYGDGETVAEMTSAELAEGCDAVGLMALIEKERRCGVFTVRRYPVDPWGDDEGFEAEEPDPERLKAFQRWLGYEV